MNTATKDLNRLRQVAVGAESDNRFATKQRLNCPQRNLVALLSFGLNLFKLRELVAVWLRATNNDEQIAVEIVVIESSDGSFRIGILAYKNNARGTLQEQLHHTLILASIFYIWPPTCAKSQSTSTYHCSFLHTAIQLNPAHVIGRHKLPDSDVAPLPAGKSRVRILIGGRVVHELLHGSLG